MDTQPDKLLGEGVAGGSVLVWKTKIKMETEQPKLRQNEGMNAWGCMVRLVCDSLVSSAVGALPR